MLQEMKENLFEGLKAGAYTASTSGDMTLHVFLGQLNYNSMIQLLESSLLLFILS